MKTTKTFVSTSLPTISISSFSWNQPIIEHNLYADCIPEIIS